MKKIRIVLIAFFTIFCLNNAKAQSHISTGKWACQLVPSSLGYEKYTCPACEVQNKKDQEAKIAEEKRRFADAQAAATAKKGAREKERLEKIEADKKNAESGKVYINGNNNNSTTHTSTEQIPDSYTGNPLHYNNPNISSGSNTIDNINKSYQQGQQIAELGTGLADLFSPSQEKIQRMLTEKRKSEERASNREKYFKSMLNKYLDAANKGDENARMLLIFEAQGSFLYGPDLKYLVPNWSTWLKQGIANKNIDAINFAVRLSFYEPEYSFFTIDEGLKILEEAGELGSPDAFFSLGIYYSIKKNKIGKMKIGGNDSRKALNYYLKASALGFPEADYTLGNIYSVQYVGNKGYGVKFDIEQNDSLALKYFYKSAFPEKFIPSIYYEHYAVLFSFYSVKSSLLIISNMYEKGIDGKKDEVMAKKYFDLSNQ